MEPHGSKMLKRYSYKSVANSIFSNFLLNHPTKVPFYIFKILHIKFLSHFEILLVQPIARVVHLCTYIYIEYF